MEYSHLVGRYAHESTVRCLICSRAVIDWPDVTGCTALARAAGRGYEQVRRILSHCI